jgi:hypothetical protein
VDRFAKEPGGDGGSAELEDRLELPELVTEVRAPGAEVLEAGIVRAFPERRNSSKASSAAWSFSGRSALVSVMETNTPEWMIAEPVEPAARGRSTAVRIGVHAYPGYAQDLGRDRGRSPRRPASTSR